MSIKKNNQSKLDPNDVFFRARISGWRGFMIAKKIGKTRAAVSQAFAGLNDNLLQKIDRIISKPVPRSLRQLNSRGNPRKINSKASKRGVDFSQPRKDEQ